MAQALIIPPSDHYERHHTSVQPLPKAEPPSINPRASPGGVINLDELSLSEWTAVGAGGAISPSPPIALATKLPHFLPAGVTTSTRLIPLSLILRNLGLQKKRLEEEELVSIALQMLDAVASCEIYGRVVGKEFAGGFITLDTVMTDEQQSNYYIVGCRYGTDKAANALVLGRGGVLESFCIPPWGLPGPAELRQGATTRGAFGRVSSAVSFWSIAILLCECILLRHLPVPKSLQQAGVYRATSPVIMVNMVISLIRSKGCSEAFADFIRSLMMDIPADVTNVGHHLQDPIIYKYVNMWMDEGTHSDVVQRYKNCYMHKSADTRSQDENPAASGAQSPST